MCLVPPVFGKSVSLSLLVVVATAFACGGDDGNVNYPPFPEPTGAPDAAPRPDGPVVPPGPADPIINEFRTNDPAPEDANYAEIYGDPNHDYSDYTLITIEGDSAGNGRGVIDFAAPIGTTNANGYYLVPINDFDFDEGTQTVLLVENYTGTTGTTDVDDANDGTIDLTPLPWDSVVDGFALDEELSATEYVYTTGLGTTVPIITGHTTAIGGYARIPDGTDTDAAGDFLPIPEDGVATGPTEANETPGTDGATNTQGT